MTKQFRNNLILLITIVIFVAFMFITNHLWWTLIIVFGTSLLVTWLLNKYKPLKNEPKPIWWQELLSDSFFIIILLVAVQVKFNDSIFTLYHFGWFCAWLLVDSLRIFLHRDKKSA